MEAYRARIEANRKAIQGITPEAYPYLYQLLTQRNNALQGRLLAMLQRMQTIDNQEKDRDGNYWYYESLRHFAVSGQESARTPITWYKSIILLCCLGLIWRQKPTEDATTPYQVSANSHRRTDINAQWQAIGFYSTPEYTPVVLDQAERRAKAWIQRGATIRGLSKETIIEVFGQRVANMIYQDERRKTNLHKELESIFIKQAKAQIKVNGFTTKEGIIKGTVEATYQAFLKKECVSPLLMPEEEARRRAWQEVKRVYENRGKILLERSKLIFRRPTNEEKERYGLDGNGWIMLKK
jgi:hypothetical protein